MQNPIRLASYYEHCVPDEQHLLKAALLLEADADTDSTNDLTDIANNLHQWAGAAAKMTLPPAAHAVIDRWWRGRYAWAAEEGGQFSHPSSSGAAQQTRKVVRLKDAKPVKMTNAQGKASSYDGETLYPANHAPNPRHRPATFTGASVPDHVGMKNPAKRAQFLKLTDHPPAPKAEIEPLQPLGNNLGALSRFAEGM